MSNEIARLQEMSAEHLKSDLFALRHENVELKGRLEYHLGEIERLRDEVHALMEIIAINCDPFQMTKEDAAIQQECYLWFDKQESSDE